MAKKLCWLCQEVALTKEELDYGVCWGCKLAMGWAMLHPRYRLAVAAIMAGMKAYHNTGGTHKAKSQAAWIKVDEALADPAHCKV